MVRWEVMGLCFSSIMAATKLDYLGQRTCSLISCTCDYHMQCINSMNVELIFILTLQDNGKTVLLYAVANGMIDLVQKLLEQGADFNIIDMVCHVNTLFRRFIGSLYKP